MPAVHTSKRSSPSPILCANCRQALGGALGIVPFCIGDDDGRGDGKMEAWCPQCFCGVRAPADPERFPRLADGRMPYAPIKCVNASCLLTSVAIGLDMHGQPTCGQCGSRRIVVLPATGAKIVLPVGGKS